jgi:hypothetical protein
MTRLRTGPLLLALLAALLPACRGGSAQKDLTLAGSTSIQPFADKWAEVFMEAHPDFGVNVQGGGSSAGIMACKSGACQIGMSSRELKADEKDLFEIVIARDGLAIVVHPSNPVRGVRLAEVKQIFSGDLKNWKFLGGPDRSITVVTREEGSGTRGAFQELVMGKIGIFGPGDRRPRSLRHRLHLARARQRPGPGPRARRRAGERGDHPDRGLQARPALPVPQPGRTDGPGQAVRRFRPVRRRPGPDREGGAPAGPMRERGEAR